MTTEQLLFESRMAVMNVVYNEVGLIAIVAFLICFTFLFFAYMPDCWPFAPRKRHGRKFTERF